MFCSVCCSTIVSKPKEFAHLIKNRFGSADNITQMSEFYKALHQDDRGQCDTKKIFCSADDDYDGGDDDDNDGDGGNSDEGDAGNDECCCCSIYNNYYH